MTELACAWCGAGFEPSRITMRFCSAACRHANSAERQRMLAKEPTYRVRHREYQKRWRLANPTRNLATDKRYRESHRDTILARMATRYEEQRGKHGKRPRSEYLAAMQQQTAANAAVRRERQLARKRVYYAENRETIAARYKRWREANLHVGRQKARRRRARERGVRIERYVDADIYERDGWRCRLCGRPVDPMLPRTHRAGATIDHVVPITAGGADAPDNVQLAHMACNSAKGATVAA